MPPCPPVATSFMFTKNNPMITGGTQTTFQVYLLFLLVSSQAERVHVTPHHQTRGIITTLLGKKYFLVNMGNIVVIVKWLRKYRCETFNKLC